MKFLTANGWEFAVLLGCLLASAFFSGSETALFTLRRWDLQHLQSSGGWRGRCVVRLARKPGSLLNTLLLGNMLVNIAFSATAAVLVLEMERQGASAWQLAAGAVAPLLAIILFGEVTPKMLAYSVARRWAVIAAGPIRAIQWLFSPVLWVLQCVLVGPVTQILAPRRAGVQNITAEELAELVSLSQRRGILDAEAGAFLREIVELTDVRARDVMVPRVDMVAYDIEKDADGLVQLFRRTALRKVPVYENDLDNILGVIHARRLLLHPATPLRELVRPVPFLPEGANLEKILAQFRRTRKQMAIVVDEYGGTAGLISLEDVLEEIVGDIPDVNDPDSGPAVHKESPTRYLICGDLAIRDWAEVFNLDAIPAGGRISTLGGFVTSLLGHIPRAGDSVEYRNLRFTVLAMRGRRIGTVRVELLETEAGP